MEILQVWQTVRSRPCASRGTANLQRHRDIPNPVNKVSTQPVNVNDKWNLIALMTENLTEIKRCCPVRMAVFWMCMTEGQPED